MTLNRNFLVLNATGTFTCRPLTSHTGTVVEFDNNRNILEINTSVTLNEGDVITTITGATATVHQSSPSLQQYRLELLEQQLVTLLLIKAKHLWIQCVFKIQITIKTILMLFVLVSQSIGGHESIRRSVHLPLECLW